MPRSLQLLLLVLAPLAVFAAMIWTDRTFGTSGPGRDYVVRLDLPPAGDEIGLPKVEGPLDASRPLVVIDAGHGGLDPGAGGGAVKEKDLTLRLAQALRDALLDGGGVRVALTRDDDRFLVLGERAGIARRLRADLFLSIHADSTAGAEASGATVYTLSERGTDEARTAELYAEHLTQVERFLARRRCFSTVMIEYGQVLAEPHAQAKKIQAFLGRALDIERMATVADPALHRNRRA